MITIRRVARLLPLLAVVLAVLLPGAVAAQAAGAPEVAVPGGVIRGATVDGDAQFLGIPYAAPPLGALRWRAPAPVVPWAGVRDATAEGPACLQNDEGWNHADWLRAAEDCLTLDVRTPGLAGHRPVMVWIHGGSNRAGSGAGTVASTLARHGVVVVSLQYRLGVLGFLANRALAAEQGGHAGNYGLMDQIAALRWVHDTIARFGGDPDQVTMFGESAGSQDVSLLLAAPAARGLFRAAVLQSGTPGFGMPFRPLDQALLIGDQLDQLAGTGGDLARLRALSPLALFALQSRLTDPAAHGNDFLFLRTTIDGAVLPDAPDRLLAARAPLPVIIGTNRIEFGPAPGSVDPAQLAQYWFGARAAPALQRYRAETAAGIDPRDGTLELRMQSDAQFHCPANRLARRLTELGWPVWRHDFDLNPAGGLTRHALDVGYVFSGQTVADGATMQGYWLNLARRLNPNHGEPGDPPLPAWPALTPTTTATMEFHPDHTRATPGLPRDDACGDAEAW